VQKALRPTFFAGLLLLAAYLRVTGLAWGLTSGYGHDRNLQPDEFVSLRGVLQLDLLTGCIKAPGAYFEGTFNYYLWAVPQAVLKISSQKDSRLSSSINANDHSDLLYLGRWMSVLFDLCTIVIVFLAITEVTQNFYSSLLGALCYAVLPMQVIYAHFMRTHILSNLLCALVIWLSLKLRKSQQWQMLLTTGFISGLAGATRYPAGIIVVIPCLYLLVNASEELPDRRLQLWERTKGFVAGPVWLMGLGFAIGLFLGHPMLFLDLPSVTKAITGETLKYATLQEFSISQLIDLSVVWKYITYLIPFAMYPFLWLIPYCAILYLVFRRGLYNQSVPILIFSFLYLYFMAKGYLGPYFARTSMLLFPGFCVLCGIAYRDLLLRLKDRRIVAVALAGALLLVLGPSVFFDVAYGRAMQQKDARLVLRADLQRSIGEAPATIGIFRLGPYFYTAMPAAEPLSNERVTIRLQDTSQPADFFLVGFGRPIDTAQLDAIIRQIEQQGNFKYERTYSMRPKIFERELPLARFPSDMTYPFPTILLFRAKTEA
jgi:4-amino-4-deoxy-L-arabinose transferase and related glycosyltransferases of PMT family